MQLIVRYGKLVYFTYGAGRKQAYLYTLGINRHILRWWARGAQSPPKRIVFRFHAPILRFGDWMPRDRGYNLYNPFARYQQDIPVVTANLPREDSSHRVQLSLQTQIRTIRCETAQWQSNCQSPQHQWWLHPESKNLGFHSNNTIRNFKNLILKKKNVWTCPGFAVLCISERCLFFSVFILAPAEVSA